MKRDMALLITLIVGGTVVLPAVWLLNGGEYRELPEVILDQQPAREKRQDQAPEPPNDLDSTTLGEDKRQPAHEAQSPPVDSSEPPRSSSNLYSATDPSGFTTEGKLDCLMAAWEDFLERSEEAKPPGAVAMEAMFASRAVITILREQGRAHYPPPDEMFSLSPLPGEDWVAGSDRARFTWRKGEFPAYDLAMERLQKQGDGEVVEPLSEEQHGIYESLYQEALASLGAHPAREK